MTTWHSIWVDLPTDGSSVWIRAPYWFSAPAEATWDLASATFTTIDTGMVAPWYAISRWRDL